MAGPQSSTPTPRACGSSATCRSSWPTTAPMSGRTASCFKLDERPAATSSPACRPTISAPPASSGAIRSTTGTACAVRGYDWWLRRLRAGRCTLFDLVRLDHFRGFVAHWEIPGRGRQRPPAGRWMPGPAAALFRSRHAAARPAAADRRGPGRDHARRRSAPRRVRLSRHASAAVCLRRRSRRRPTTCRTTTSRTASSIPARTTTTRPSAGSTARPAKARRAPPSRSPASAAYALAYLNTDGSEIHWDLIRLAMASVARLADLSAAGRAGPGNRGPHEPAQHQPAATGAGGWARAIHAPEHRASGCADAGRRLL